MGEEAEEEGELRQGREDEAEEVKDAEGGDEACDEALGEGGELLCQLRQVKQPCGVTQRSEDDEEEDCDITQQLEIRQPQRHSGGGRGERRGHRRGRRQR